MIGVNKDRGVKEKSYNDSLMEWKRGDFRGNGFLRSCGKFSLSVT